MHTHSLRLGLDIGGTNIKTALLTPDNEILHKSEIPSHASQGAAAVRAAVLHAINSSQTKSIECIGVGCAGSVDSQRGVVINSPNFANWSNVPLAQWIMESTNIPASIHNDANCAVIAESRLGAGRGSANLVLLTFGTGIGGGIIVDNKLYLGSTGTAAELGHLCVKYDGIKCPCGNTGCFERYCSAKYLMQQFPQTPIETIFREVASNKEYQLAIQAMLNVLKIGLTSISNIFDPDCILLGGGLSKGFWPYLTDIRTWVREHSFPSIGQNTEIRMCELENWAGAIGAALQAPTKKITGCA